MTEEAKKDLKQMSVDELVSRIWITGEYASLQEIERRLNLVVEALKQINIESSITRVNPPETIHSLREKIEIIADCSDKAISAAEGKP